MRAAALSIERQRSRVRVPGDEAGGWSLRWRSEAGEEPIVALQHDVLVVKQPQHRSNPPRLDLELSVPRQPGVDRAVPTGAWGWLTCARAWTSRRGPARSTPIFRSCASGVPARAGRRPCAWSARSAAGSRRRSSLPAPSAARSSCGGTARARRQRPPSHPSTPRRGSMPGLPPPLKPARAGRARLTRARRGAPGRKSRPARSSPVVPAGRGRRPDAGGAARPGGRRDQQRRGREPSRPRLANEQSIDGPRPAWSHAPHTRASVRRLLVTSLSPTSISQAGAAESPAASRRFQLRIAKLQQGRSGRGVEGYAECPTDAIRFSAACTKT